VKQQGLNPYIYLNQYLHDEQIEVFFQTLIAQNHLRRFPDLGVRLILCIPG
jgi:hypothetical protein